MSENKRFTNVIKDKRFLNRLFVWAMCMLELILLAVIGFIVYKLFNLEKGETVFEFIALGLLILWFGILVAYYAWAVYFYNLNLGQTNEDWLRIKEKVKYDPDAEKDIPVKNPNDGETLGLPKGTVRGSLALTLMVGGLAMTIIAIGMENKLSENEFLVDNFDFFKTAFLMMIAFYFGNKSLELIDYKSRRIIGHDNVNTTSTVASDNIPIAPGTNLTQVKTILKNGFKPSDGNISVEVEKNNNDNFFVPGAEL